MDQHFAELQGSGAYEVPLYIDSLDCPAARQGCEQSLLGCHLQGLCRSWELAASAPEASSLDPGDRLGALRSQVLSRCSNFLWLWLRHALQRGQLTILLPLPNSLHEASWVVMMTQLKPHTPSGFQDRHFSQARAKRPQ